MIHDAQFTPDEIDLYAGWGHSDWASAIDLALKANARELILFHHNPSRSDDELAIIESQCRDLLLKNGSDMIVHAAREGHEMLI